MYLNFDDDRPDTPRVPATLSRLERVLIVVVAYQALMLAYFFAPEGVTQPLKNVIAQVDPLRYVEVQPIIDRSAIPRTIAPPASTPAPVPARENDGPRSTDESPDRIEARPDIPQAQDTARTVANMGRNDAPPMPARAPGGLLSNALKSLGRMAPSPGSGNPNDGAVQPGPDIQFDSKGVDFGPWLRRFRAQVIGNWMIPQSAQILKGHVVIQMAIHRSGMLTNIHMVQSSGIEPFDQAAMTALRLSNPTLQLPADYPGEVIDPFTVIFYYNEPVLGR